MNYSKLADLIRQFNSTELLANEIESIEDSQKIETIDDLCDFLGDELDYGNY